MGAIWSFTLLLWYREVPWAGRPLGLSGTPRLTLTEANPTHASRIGDQLTAQPLHLAFRKDLLPRNLKKLLFFVTGCYPVSFIVLSFPQVFGELLLRDQDGAGLGRGGEERNSRPGEKTACGPSEPQAVAQSCTLLTVTASGMGIQGKERIPRASAWATLLGCEKGKERTDLRDYF